MPAPTDASRPRSHPNRVGGYALVDDLFLCDNPQTPTPAAALGPDPYGLLPAEPPKPPEAPEAGPPPSPVADPLEALDWLAGQRPVCDGPQATAETPDLKLSVPLVYWMGGEDWDDEDPEEEPDLIPVEGGLPLLYAGRSHLVFGAGGSGKTWFVLYCVAQVLKAGGKVLYIDYEMRRSEVKSRLKKLGVTRAEAAGLAYWRVTGGFRGDQLDALGWLVGMYRFTLVTLDSVSKALSTLDLNESGNVDYHHFDDTVVVPLTYRDITVLMIDHTGNDSPVVGPANRPRGASGKRDSISGASYWFRVAKKDAWTRERSGQAQLRVHKERGGFRAPESLAARMLVEVHDKGARLDIRLVADTDTDTICDRGTDADNPRSPLTVHDYAEKIADYLATVGVASGKQIIERARLGRNAHVREALAYLVEQNALTVTPGPGGGSNYRLAADRPRYRACLDPNSDSSTPGADPAP